MCDDFFDDFEDDFDYDADDGYFEDHFEDSDTEAENGADNNTDNCFVGIGWCEIALLGAMSEDLASERKNRKRIRKKPEVDDKN